MHHVCVIGVASALGISTRHFDTDFRTLFHSDDFAKRLRTITLQRTLSILSQHYLKQLRRH